MIASAATREKTTHISKVLSKEKSLANLKYLGFAFILQSSMLDEMVCFVNFCPDIRKKEILAMY